VLAAVKELRAGWRPRAERVGRHGLRSFLFSTRCIGFNSAQQEPALACPGWKNGKVTPLIGPPPKTPAFEVEKVVGESLRRAVFRLQPLEAGCNWAVLSGDGALADPERG